MTEEYEESEPIEEKEQPIVKDVLISTIQELKDETAQLKKQLAARAKQEVKQKNKEESTDSFTIEA